MIDAAKTGDPDLVIKLARSNPFIPANVSIEPALLAACECGQLSVVRACIEELKCNPNCVDKSGRSPLHMTVLNKSNGKIAVSILKFLIANGAKIRKSVLHVCANDFAVFPLIELRADVNALSVDGMTPLAVAVAADRQDVVSELLRAGATRDDQLIFKANSPSVVYDLVRYKADVNMKDSQGNSALHYAVLTNNKPLARALLESKADPSTLYPITETSVLAQLEAIRDRLGEVTDLDKVESVLSEMTRKVSEMKTKVSQNNLCTICKTEQKCVVLMPCRHFCVCQQCSLLLQDNSFSSISTPSLPSTCPICRSEISDYVSIYI